ncbi:glycosyltransferase family 8 protein [Carboxylicivirga sediminis]|uniref:Glycosyltransferase family 8 protein n=1 Tax=Carboxylicivirga sediminis TaxID=2006564 RepID=A0A941IX65_9BACT|nr:glycosyltransferase family 8 protein [Carboxylicivirga sediminis]MBR8535064.1 glycosyltransferase family 8 protein [Carboxylicivirga sediminis]
MTIPIVISFNDNFTTPTGVCLTSLCLNAKPETKYEVHVLYSNRRLSKENKSIIKKLEESFSNISISFINVKTAFENSYEIRNITIEAYYRLLIPNYFKSLSKIIYIDVDTIINNDLSSLFNNELNDKSLAGVPEFTYKNEPFQSKHIKSLSLDPKNYINSGILIFNLNKIRSEIDKYNNNVKELSKLNFLYQDQDILNILFKDDILYIEHTYNYTYSKLKEGLVIPEPVIIHYTMQKPWHTTRPFGDVWWNHYKRSLFFEPISYTNYQLKAFDSIETHIKVGKTLKRLGIYRFLFLLRLFTGSIKSIFNKL